MLCLLPFAVFITFLARVWMTEKERQFNSYDNERPKIVIYTTWNVTNFTSITKINWTISHS